MASYLPWTARAAGEHPRFWINDVNGPTLAAMRARCLGDYLSYYNLVKSYCSGKYNNTSSYFDNKDPEYTTSFAFAWLITPNTSGTLYAYGRKAIDVALYMAGLSLATGDLARKRCLTMAIVYDWCYSHPSMTTAYKTTLRNRVADYVEALYTPNTNEYLWGNDSGDSGWILPAIVCILNDGESSGDSSYLNSSWDTWMDTLMDARDDGTGTGHNPPHRYFADVTDTKDGGTHKGSGQFSYVRENEIYYSRMFPAMKSAVGQDWWTSEEWYKLWCHWILWHWRCDKTWHLQGDTLQVAHYDMFTQCHFMQVAAIYGETNFGLACQWMVHEIQTNADLGYAIWGPYYQWYCLWYDKTLGENLTDCPPPTIAGYGGGNQMKTFSKIGKIVFRDGWETASSSVTVSIPKVFTGGHQHRDAGHFDLASQGKVLLTQHGHYTGNQTYTYKRASLWHSPLVAADPTGHRYSYYKRIISKNAIRIYDTDEPAENDLDGFHLSFSHSSHFGVYNEGTSGVDRNNIGDQLWPKNTAGDNDQPDDLNDIYGGALEAKWVFDSWAVTPSETSTYCYAVADLLPFYFSSKCSKYHRHFLWLKAGAVPGWGRPILLVWDDITTHVDASGSLGGKKTRIYQLQPLTSPSGTAGNLTFTDGSVKMWHRMLSPASLETATVLGYFDPNAIEFPPSTTSAIDDDGTLSEKAYRVDIWPATAGSNPWNTAFVSLLAWGLDSDPALPDLALIDDDTYIGVQFGGVGGLEAKFAKGDTHSVVVAQDTAPAAPVGLTASPYSVSRIDLDWTDNSEDDFNHYHIFKSKMVDGVYEDWGSSIANSDTSAYSATGLDSSTTYRFKVTALDDASQESLDSDIVSSTTLSPPPASGTGAGVAPWRPKRRFSKFQLGDL